MRAADALRDAASPEGRTWLLAATLAIVAAAVVEGLVLSRRRGYDWRAFAATLGDVVGRRIVDALGLSVAGPLIVWVHAHRLATITLDGPGALLLLFVGQEFCYYWHHRAGHRVRWFWATHCVHHSPNVLTLASALRLGWTAPLTGGVLFFAPLVWLGFAPLAVLGALAANLLYQFWLHATWIPALGPLEGWLNTPSAHRVHHARNTPYLDRNYGGVLLVFDRLFGTYVPERTDEPPRYGLATPLHSHNPLRIALHGWIALARDLRRARGLRDIVLTLFGPPDRLPAAPQPIPRRKPT